MPLALARLAALALLAPLSACGSMGARERARLPFHVALLPVTVSAHAADATAADDDVALTLDPERVRASLAEVLGEECFVRVSVTDPAVLPGDDPAALQAELAAAAAQGADLVLACSVDHDPSLRAKRNEKFWLNLPLFLLGGPACYFIDDHSYVGNARLRASLQDVHPLVDGRATLADGRCEYLYVEGRLSDLTLDFLDRAPGAGSYLLSLLVPSGLLAGRGSRVDESLAEHAADELAHAVADELLRSAGPLLAGARTCPFFLGDDVALRTDERGTIVSGRVLVRRDSPVRLAACRARVGSAATTYDFPRQASSPPGERYDEYPFELRLDDHGPLVRLEIAAGGRDVLSRSYTLSVP